MTETIEQKLIFKNDALAATLIFALFFTTITTQGVLSVENVTPVTNTMNIQQIITKNKNITDEIKEEEDKIDVVKEKQKWEAGIRNRYKYGQIKTIDEGIKHIYIAKRINKRPIKINVIEINRTINPNINLAPALATDNKLASKSSIRKIAKNNNSIVAINGSFFKPQNGIPLGSLMIDGKLLTGPMYNRVALGIFDNEYKMDRVQLNASVVSKDYTLKIDNINQPRMLSTYVLGYTKEWGKMAPPSPKYGMQIAIEDNKVVAASESTLEIPQNGYVIVGPKEKLKEFSLNKKVNVNISTNPDWTNVNHIISGGPYLLKNGNVFIDVKEQKLNSITGRNPRTAVGVTNDGNLVLITVDGREETSVGMTLTELATFMKSIGCVEAMNLDGGGSSIMYVNGNIVNQPSIKGGIALSNALTVSITERISLSETK